jgi:hypothetical protein
LTICGIWGQWKDSGVSETNRIIRGETSWAQQALVPPRLVHARLDLGWAAEERLGMWAVEVLSPIDGTLLAASVDPLHAYPDLVTCLLKATAGQRAILLELLDPDPF